MSSGNEGLAQYYFLPYLREGLATLIQADASGPRASVGIKLRATGEGGGSGAPGPADIGPAAGVELYGPGDVVGFNDIVVTRCEPKPDVGDFEAAFFPFIEAEQADFFWRFTASAIPDDGHVKPWITLIVLVAEDVPDASQPDGIAKRKEFFEQTEFAMPALANAKAPYIVVDSMESLPDLDESWRWAHVQVTTDGSITSNRASELERIIQNEPDRTVARLLCARRLRPGTLYRAFVVPTFRHGVFAGLGMDFTPGTSAMDLAWNSTNSLQDVTSYVENATSGDSGIALPYYYTWEFRTGLRGGDFEALVRRLKSRKLAGLGMRDVDCGRPGYGPLGVVRQDESGEEVHTLGLEGALMSLDTEPTKWGHDVDNWSALTTPEPFQLKLATLVNKPKADLDTGTTRPKIVPPIYGRWHAAKEEVNANSKSWLNVLNLDPRHRMVAAFGTQVVQKQQEELMASAWDQLGAVDEANEILRRAQLGRETSIEIHEHRLKAMSLGDLIRATSPVHARVLMESDVGTSTAKASVRQRIQGSRIPTAALDPALRRIGRNRGPLRKRQKPDSDPKRKDILERLNDGSLRAAGPPPEPDGALRMCQISLKQLHDSGLTKVAEKLCPKEHWDDPGKVAETLNLFCERNITCETLRKIPGRPDFGTDMEKGVDKPPQEGKDSPEAAAFRNLLLELCEELESADEPKELGPIDLDEVKETLIKELDPRKTVVERTRSRLRLVDVPEQGDPLDQIMAAPEFDAPMYKPLEEISQELLLPGLETVPQNTIALLQTNGRFVEAYSVGLNHEMARELLWREYPMDQRGSYFRQFWDVTEYVPTDHEIDSLLTKYLDEKGITDISALDLDEKVLVIRRNEPKVGNALQLTNDEIEDLVDALRGNALTEDKLRETDQLIKTFLLEELLEEKLRDIAPIHTWRENELGKNDNRSLGTGQNGENIVLLIVADLLRKRPHTIIFAVEGRRVGTDGILIPSLREHLLEHMPDEHKNKTEEELPVEWRSGARKDPIFSGQLPLDITFLGFELKRTDVRSDPGWYIVIEDRVSESQHGFDMATAPATEPPDTPDDVTWGHIRDLQDGEKLKDDVYLNSSAPDLPPSSPDWDESSAAIAKITLQKPFRIAVHASKMIPDSLFIVEI